MKLSDQSSNSFIINLILEHFPLQGKILHSLMVTSQEQPSQQQQHEHDNRCINLLQIAEVTDSKWLAEFAQLEGGSLTKCLLLVAVMRSQALIDDKECRHFKQFLMVCQETRTNQIVASFLRNSSLITLRSVIRGH